MTELWLKSSKTEFPTNRPHGAGVTFYKYFSHFCIIRQLVRTHLPSDVLLPDGPQIPFKSLTLETMEDVCQFPFLSSLPNPRSFSEIGPFLLSLTSLFPALWGVIWSFLYLIMFPSLAKSRLWCTGTLSLLVSLSPSFTFSPPVFLGTQVLQEFHETFTQAVQVCIPSVCQTAPSLGGFSPSPHVLLLTKLLNGS